MIKKFIETLAKYYKHENDLSNITRVLAVTDEDFKSKFLRFFFPDIDIAKVIEIDREKPDDTYGDSRVDLYISMEEDDKPYIIEVKIGDRNQHFGQYDDAYGVTKERFGYITNYNCIEGKELGYDVKTWEEFYDYMSAFTDNSELTSGYLSYLKSVCNIIKYNKPMNLEGLSTIPCFLDTAKKIIETMDVDLELYNDKNYCYQWSVHQGFYFNCKDNKEKNCYGVIGLWFNEKPVITFGINNHPDISANIIKNKSLIVKDTEYITEPYYERCWQKDDVWFELSDEKTRLFQNAKTLDEQYSILYEFVKEALQRIMPYM